MNKALIFSSEKKFKKFEKEIKDKVLKVLKILGENNALIEIYLIGDSEMRFLNRKFMRKDKPTDILSFKEPKKFPHPETELCCLGEIYLDMLYIKKEAAAGQTVDYESLIIKLLIHGALHLLGYSHGKKNDRIKMEEKENYVYKRLRHRLGPN